MRFFIHSVCFYLTYFILSKKRADVLYRRIFVACISCFILPFGHAVVLNIQPNSVNAQAWVVYDPQTKQVITEHNSHQQRAPASLTKMMVAYIVLQEIQSGRLSKEQQIPVTSIVEQVQDDESQMKLVVGEQVSIDHLLSGLIISSANDAALLLAQYLGAGNTETFVKQMNQHAQTLGMKATRFLNPSGITMDQHLSTAHDLTLLSVALIEKTPDYLTYSKQKSFTYKGIQFPATNILLERDTRIDGLKTGYTQVAGYNLALSAIQSPLSSEVNTPTLNQRRLVAVVLGTPSIEQRAKISHQLLNISFEYTQNVLLFKKSQTITKIPLKDAVKETLDVVAHQDYYFTGSRYPNNASIDLRLFDQKTLRIIQKQENGLTKSIDPSSTPQLSYQITLKQPYLTAPISQTEYPLFDLHLQQYQKNIHQMTFTENIHIEKITLWQRIIRWFTHLFN